MKGIKLKLFPSEIEKAKKSGYDVHYSDNKAYILITTMDEIQKNNLREYEYYGVHIMWNVSIYEIEKN